MKDYEQPEELYRDLLNVMNKSFAVTLQEQYDHVYLPKFREVFNRLDEWHRLTNYDDFEQIVRLLAYNDAKGSTTEEKKLSVDESKFLLNKFVDINHYP